MTDWSPDTCGCIIRVSDWDNGIGISLINCPAHRGMKDNDHFQQVYKNENQIKNLLLGHIQKNIPSALIVNQIDISTPITNMNSLNSTSSQLADSSMPPPTDFTSAYGIAGSLSFDANRNIILQTSGLQPSDITTLQDHCDQTYGVGKVTVS